MFNTERSWSVFQECVMIMISQLDIINSKNTWIILWIKKIFKDINRTCLLLLRGLQQKCVSVACSLRKHNQWYKYFTSTGVLQGSFGKVTNVVRNMWLEDYQFSPVPSCTSRQAPVDLGSQLSYYDVQVDKPRREGSFQVLIA